MLDPFPIEEFLKEFNQKATEAYENQENWHSCSPDNPPCAVCKKLIRNVPLRLFNTSKNTELDFHFDCTGMKSFPNEDEENEFIECEFCEQFHQCNLIDEDQKKKLKHHLED